MILRALCEYYERKADAEPDAIAPPGFESVKIPFVIELREDGTVIQIADTRELVGKKNVARSFLVPQGPKKTGNVASSLLWGNAEYVLGISDPKKSKEKSEKGKRYNDRLKEMHRAFTDKILSLPEAARIDSAVQAVLKFLNNPIEPLKSDKHWDAISSSNPNLTFRLRNEFELVSQRSAVRKALDNDTSGDDPMIFCSIRGQLDFLERLHPSIKGVRDAQTSGANIVSFNLDAFNSYGKEQGANAPIGKRGAFAYTTALNRLLSSESKQRLQVGDASTVFWSARQTALETGIADIFGEPRKDDPDSNVRSIQALYEAPASGVPPAEEGEVPFYALGLSPNAARISIRFWHVSSVSEITNNIRRHFDDLKIVRPDFEPPYFSLFRLLISTAALGKAENIQPNLAAEMVRCILLGAPYPISVLQAAIGRIRAEQSKKDSKGRSALNVTYIRAALIKACINRSVRMSNAGEKELTVSLDETNLNTGYRLGRLFAVLERIQEEANPGINATIRDRFYGAASSTPVTVFSNLMKLKNHHLAKLENRGRAVNLEKLIGEIISDVNDFPAHLSLADQGRFAIGYYHQRQAFFSKSQAASA